LLALLVGLLRILLVLLLIRLIGRFVMAAVRGYRGEVAGPAAGPRLAARELVRDRICNTFVARDRAVAATVAGEVEYFCSPACRDAALADPTQPALRHG
jgi:YHS domain-containing protein